MKQGKTVIALGFFDGIHVGHGALLRIVRERAAVCGAEPMVLTFDVHPDTLIRGEPVALLNSAADRDYIIRRWYGIETVRYLRFNAQTMCLPWRDFLENVRRTYDPCHFVVGSDFTFGHRGAGSAETLRDWCAARGLGCDVLPLVQVDGETVSSTAIRALLLRGDLERANALLGHPHILSDTVRSGFHIGRTLDYPTVNMRFEEGVLVPRRGVYAVRVLLPDGSVHGGVTNIGVRPTFEGERMTVETNIFDLNADLYGRRLTLEFYGFLRPERKFDDAEQLRRQIGADAAQARSFLANRT
jgi:riboflavin kinase/FMN adenylyltransferase